MRAATCIGASADRSENSTATAVASASALHQMAVAGSGSYRKGEHGLDPRTGHPPTNGVIASSTPSPCRTRMRAATCIGASADRSENSTATAVAVALHQMAVAGSGSYRKGEHGLDPRTGHPPTNGVRHGHLVQRHAHRRQIDARRGFEIDPPGIAIGPHAGDRASARLWQPGGIALDLSGIAKGYAADAVADMLACSPLR
jgi:thiamine biosynthesis lipoprotein ApbE